MDKIILVGGFNEIIELAENNSFTIKGIIDNNLDSTTYEILGNDDDAESIYKKFGEIPILITPDIPKLREKLHQLYSRNNYKFISLISDKSNISNSCKIGLGTIIQTGVNVSAEVEIGEFVKLNTNSNVMHNSIIGNYTTIAPNAVVLGNVIVGLRCYIGANATILPNITICNDVTIGAGAVVTKDIKVEGVYVGIPVTKLP